MKSYLIKFFVFVCLCLLLDQSLTYLINRPSRHFDWRYEKVRESQLNAAILIVGSSRGARGISAEQLTKESGLNAFNFCYPGSSILFHLYCLETYLAHQTKTPKYVVLALDDDWAFKDNPWLSFRTNVLYGHTKYPDVNELLIAFGENHRLSRYFNVAKLRAVHFSWKRQEPIATDSIRPRGSMLLAVKNEHFQFKWVTPAQQIYDPSTERADYLAAYERIQQLCFEKKIQLVVAIPPNYQGPNAAFTKRVQELSSPRVPILLPNAQQKAYRDSAYYYDASHLRANGAEIYTHELNHYFERQN
ncbi:MAG: hypothetical protein RLZZ301_856 [Bacteroidota bacterium]|jgi:hypothetical protein